MTGTTKYAYIAGPMVFEPDFGASFFDGVRKLLQPTNVVPLIPVDNIANGALEIRQKNMEMIAKCDCIIANLSPFRSNEPDCGTAFEVGYAAALGKIIITYSSDARTMVEKYGGKVDGDGKLVEDFQLPFNLMLGDGSPIFGSFEEAFRHYVVTYAT